MFCLVPSEPPAIETIRMAPVTISARPTVFGGVKASFSIAAARIATISGMTPGNKAPPCAAGANSKPTLTRSTIGGSAAHNDCGEARPAQPVEGKPMPKQIGQEKRARDAEPYGGDIPRGEAGCDT